MSLSELPSDHGGGAVARIPFAVEPACSRTATATSAQRTAVVLLVPVLDALALGAVLLIMGTTPVVSVLYGSLVLLVLAVDGQQRLRICLRVSDQVPRIILAAAAPVAFLVTWADGPRLGVAALWSAISVIVLRHAAFTSLRALHRRGRWLAPAVVIGSDSRAGEIVAMLNQHPELGLVARGFVGRDSEDGRPPLGRVADLGAVVERYGIVRVVVCAPGPEDAELTRVLRRHFSPAIDIVVVPRLGELGMAVSRSRLDDVWGVPVIPLRHHGYRRVGAGVKRGFDLTVGSALLVLAAPLLAVLAAAVRLTGASTTWFRQTRVTRTARLVPVVKLRTVDGNRVGGPGWTVPAEHCTRLGRWLRATHFDELPQLVHVVRGEMSLVGPRPERPHYAVRFARSIPHYEDRHRMPGGMTGWAQVNGLHGDTSIPDRARFDNQYIEYWSPWWDLVIVVRTVGIVLREIFRSRARTLGGQR
jgi:lipopolysaccharide/colanic/teichoic acid biosynthesis glycosyltransferase